MKENPLHRLSNETVQQRRKEYLLWGMIPATVFILLEVFIVYNPQHKGMELYALGGLLLSFPFIFQASKYSKEAQRRKKNSYRQTQF